MDEDTEVPSHGVTEPKPHSRCQVETRIQGPVAKVFALVQNQVVLPAAEGRTDQEAMTVQSDKPCCGEERRRC